MSAVHDLERLLETCGLKVRIGLRQQGHMPTVERLLAEGRTWDEIGKEIGWHGPTAKKWYEMEKSHDRNP